MKKYYLLSLLFLPNILLAERSQNACAVALARYIPLERLQVSPIERQLTTMLKSDFDSEPNLEGLLRSAFYGPDRGEHNRLFEAALLNLPDASRIDVLRQVLRETFKTNGSGNDVVASIIEESLQQGGRGS